MGNDKVGQTWPGVDVSLGPSRDGGARSRRLRSAHGSAVAVAAGLLLSVAMGVEQASAGTYTMRNCNVPGHGNAPLAPWYRVNRLQPNFSIVDSCASGGGVGFALGEPRQLSSNQYEAIWLYKPVAPRNQINFVKATVWYAARLVGSGRPMVAFSHDHRSDGSIVDGLYSYAPGSENVAAEQRLAPDTVAFELGLYCIPPTPGPSAEPCVAANSVPLLIRGIEVTLSEDVLPVVSRPKGTLLEGGTQSGIRTLSYSATDPHSGLSRVDVLLGDTVVATRDLRTECFYSDFTVCPDAKTETLQVDTRAAPNGRHRLTVRVQDAAGNEQTAHAEGVEVFNAPQSPPPTDVSAYTLSARFNGRSRPTLTVPYGRRVSIRGRLTRSSQPLAAGRRIEVLERRDQPGAREVARGTVQTKADGSFTAALVTTRPSRTFRLAYRPAPDSKVVSSALKLRVRGASRLRATLRGRVVRFSGRVLSGPIAKRGKRVVMEGRSPDSTWTQFKSLRTDRSGRFSGTYRLRVRRPGVVLKIRAVVPSERGYGYVSSRSRAVALRVR